jgi:hypothetical protein
MKVNAGRQPVRMLVLSAPCTSGAEHPSTIGAPSRWVMAPVWRVSQRGGASPSGPRGAGSIAVDASV